MLLAEEVNVEHLDLTELGLNKSVEQILQTLVINEELTDR